MMMMIIWQVFDVYFRRVVLLDNFYQRRRRFAKKNNFQNWFSSFGRWDDSSEEKFGKLKFKF